MKIVFVVNAAATEKHLYTTTRLAMAAHAMGHEAYYMGLGDFAYQPDGSLAARARRGTGKTYKSLTRYLKDVQKPEVEQWLPIDDFDVVMLRNDPADDAADRPWAPTAGVSFGQLIAAAGVLVVNDPTSLANALGMAMARDALGQDYHVAAVIGDGSLTGGMALAGRLRVRCDRALHGHAGAARVAGARPAAS